MVFFLLKEKKNEIVRLFFSFSPSGGSERRRATAQPVDGRWRRLFLFISFLFTRRQFVLFRFYLVPMWQRRNSISFFRFCLFCFFFIVTGFFFFFDGVVCCFCFFRLFFFTHFEPFWRNCGNVATLCPFSGRYRVLYRVFYRVFFYSSLPTGCFFDVPSFTGFLPDIFGF